MSDYKMMRTREIDIELLKLVEQNNHMPLLYELTKVSAESDSIGECYSYCSNYDVKKFDKDIDEVRRGQTSMENYVGGVGLGLYQTLIEYKGIYIKISSNYPANDNKKFEYMIRNNNDIDYLNELGQEGWEVCCVTQSKSESDYIINEHDTTVYLKREIIE